MGDISRAGGNKLSEYGAFERPSEASHYSKYGGAKNKSQGVQKKEDKAY
jgi:hypothetical protein